MFLITVFTFHVCRYIPSLRTSSGSLSCMCMCIREKKRTSLSIFQMEEQKHTVRSCWQCLARHRSDSSNDRIYKWMFNRCSIETEPRSISSFIYAPPSSCKICIDEWREKIRMKRVTLKREKKKKERKQSEVDNYDRMILVFVFFFFSIFSFFLFFFSKSISVRGRWILLDDDFWNDGTLKEIDS